MRFRFAILVLALLTLVGCARSAPVASPVHVTPRATTAVLHCAEPLPVATSKPPHCARFEWLATTDASAPGVAPRPPLKLGAQLIINGGNASSSTPLAGDVGGTIGANTVNAISGSTPILITPNVLEWTKGTATPTLTQATPTSDVATVPLTITSQAPWASAVTNITPGNVVFSTPAPIGAGATGFTTFETGATRVASVGAFPGNTAVGALWLGNNAPTSSNYALNGTATSTTVAGSTGNLTISSTGATLNQNSFSYLAAVTAPVITQATPTSDVATVPLLIQSQAPWASAATNVTPGLLVLNVPAPVGAGAHGFVAIQDSGTTEVSLGYNFPGFIHGNRAQVLFGNPGGNGAEIISPGALFVESASGIYLEGTVNFRAYSTGTQYLSLAPTTGLFTYSAGATTPGFVQTALASTSGGSGAAGLPQAFTAQAGQAATGVAHNGGAGGNLLLSAGLGGTSGSATAGATGLVSVLGLMGGSGTMPFGFSGQTSPNTVACGTGGTQTISAAQAIIPFFLVTTGTTTSGVIVDFSTNASTGHFILDLSGVGNLSGGSLTLKNGTGTVVITATVLTALRAAGKTGVCVDTYGTNNITTT